MSKRSNTRRKDGRIAVQVYLGKVDGKRKYKTVYGATQKEADAKADELRAQVRRGVDMVSPGRTFAFWAKRLLTSKQGFVSPGWHDVLTARLSHISDRFGDVDIARIRPSDVQAVLDDIAAVNPSTGKPSGKKTMIEYSAAAKQVFRLAVLSRALDRSPMDELVTVPPGAPQKHRRALTSEQQQWVRDTPHRAQLAAMIMMYAGLRRGELTALLWSDVDLLAHTISVTKSYDARHKSVKSTKTAAGIRTVPIPDILASCLASAEHSSALVFPASDGGYMTDDTWRRLWESYMRTLNRKYGIFVGEHTKPLPIVIDTFTPHELRHTYATILYDAGVDVLTAKELLGHTDIKTTLAIYTHLSERKRADDFSKLNAFLSSANADKSLGSK